ncbi:unnamed protein product (macronuclear) [Paramecium tetraurelia]|uniref:Ion transport domain-containing protein n=1 Tax=Paramecium tetraurelia TaxID=5888 RepID=A0BDL8_PARTE|nr:uncharacterized protein GSPATT00027664001 [Paramecium tetraurelia]CAK56635.1 unnamed protein product [Paramecium tetraurelia]|eukprot:XP_001424033.1 hypothetical protein (macronuclear) [Paramecium tetraurelia strain d4-2]
MKKVESIKYTERSIINKEVTQNSGSHGLNDKFFYLQYVRKHQKGPETPERAKSLSVDRMQKQGQSSVDQLNRIQFHEETIPQDCNHEINQDNSKMSEYSLQSIEREDMIEDRIQRHTLHKSIHVYSKFVSSASHQLNMQQRSEPDPEKPGIALNLLNAFNQQQEVQSEYFNDIEYDKITRRHLKLIERNTMKDPYYVRLVKLSEFQRLNYELQKYNDNLALLNLRKAFIYVIYSIPIMARKIVNNFLFKILMTFLILFNVVLYIVVKTNGRTDTDNIEEVVMILFISEIGLRIIASGIFFNDYAFFRNMENIYDFVLIFFTAMNLYYPEIIIIDISPLRLVTLLMYLTNIFQGLNVMMTALRQSFKFLVEALMIVILFSLIFASMGIFLFQGLFNYRCQYENGDETEGWIQCNQAQCPSGMHCMYSDYTPKMPTSFNNLIGSLGQILRTITMDDWSWVMFFTMRIFHPWVWLYYLLIIFIGGFFGFNIVIAVLKVHYSEATEENKKREEENEIQKRLKEEEEYPERNLLEILDVAHLREIKIYKVIKKYRTNLNEESLKQYSIEDPNSFKMKQYQTERTLSAKQKQLESGIIKLPFIEYITSFTWKRFLLPKFDILDALIKKIKVKNYTEVEFDMKVIEKLKTIKFSRLQPQVNMNVKQNFTSSNDVLLKLIDIQDQIQKEKNFNLEKIRSTKFQMIYHQIKIEKDKLYGKTQFGKSAFPTKSKSVSPFMSIYQKKVEQSTDSIVNFDQINLKSLNKMKATQILETKYKTFYVVRNGKPYIHIQGYYTNFDGVKLKINQKIPMIVHDQVSNKFKYQSMRMKEYQNHRRITKHNWSGKDVLEVTKFRMQYFHVVLSMLNKVDIIIWINGIRGIYIMSQKYAFIIVTSRFSQFFFDLVILNNFTFLSLQGIVDINIISTVEDISTIFLCFELMMRFLGFRFKDLLRSPDLILQSVIVIINFFELTISDYMTNYLSEQNLRLIRGTKCLLFYRCLKYNKMAITIGHIASMTFDQYIYLTFLMFLVIFMYALTGMEMFVGKFDQNDSLGQLHSYENIFKSFMTIFNIMTNDDWYGVYVIGSDIDFTFSIIYSFSLVLILNYLTYGLVMAVLLDGFGKYLDQPVEEIQNEIQKNINEQLQHITQNSDEIQMQLVETNQDQQMPNKNLSNDEINKSKPNLIYNLIKSIKQINKKLLSKTPKLYEGIECESSLFLFEKDNLFRIVLTHLTTSMIYVYIMDIVTYLSIIAFILKTYNDYETDSESYPDTLQFSCNIIQLADTIFNVIAKGLYMDQGSYLVSTFQVFDFIYQVSNIIAFGKDPEDFKPILKILLYLGYFRPMKLMYRLSWLTNLREAIGRSLFDILNVIITLLSVWIMFGVYGIILYEQQFGYCEDKMAFEVNKQTCQEEGKIWVNYKHNFDNITIAIPTLFVTATLDGWGEIYQIAENSQVASIGPQGFNSYIVTYIFFLLFVFIGSMFFLSLFTGVLYTNLKKNQREIENTEVTQSQKEFKEISQMLINDFPQFSTPPTNGIRKMASDITSSLTSQKCLFLLLWVDFIILLMFTSDMSDEYFRRINDVHNALTGIYLIWVILLFLALGVNRFFDNSWRRFYFFLIVIAVIDFVADYSVDWIMIYYKSTPNDEGFQLLRLFFSLRSLRIILIFQGFINLQRLINVILFALPYLGKIFSILIITMLVFALFGCQLFGTIDKGQVLDDQLNFMTAGSAMMTLFKCASGDDWRTIMTDTMHYNPLCWEDPKYCGSFASQIYFFLFMFFSTYVLLTLFLLSLVEQFESFFQLQASPIQSYVENIDKIKTIWCKYSSDTQGQTMHYKFLCKFLLDIGKPFGGGEEENLWDVAKIASSFKLKCDHYGYIQYNQLIYELFRVKFHADVFKEGTPDSIKQIKQFNKEMQLRLMYYRKNRHIERSNISSALQLKANFNILHDYLTVLILFKTWESYSKILIRKLAIKQNQFSDDAISIDSELQQNNNNNVNHIMEPDMFEASCEEATINCNFENKKHHHTNESQNLSHIELPIFKSASPFSIQGEDIKMIFSAAGEKQPII